VVGLVRAEMVVLVLQLQFLVHLQLTLVEVVVDLMDQVLQMEAEELVAVGQEEVLQELLEHQILVAVVVVDQLQVIVVVLAVKEL
jgi:hypothetical protein